MKKIIHREQNNRLKSYVFAAGLLTVTGSFLAYPRLTSEFACIGLKTWFDHMIITLFPMMVMISLLKDTGYYRLLMKPLTPVLKPLLWLPAEGIFVIFFGFLSGFPLGAKLTCELYEDGKIDRKTADYLLAFVNNIGPAYFSGFVMGSIMPHERNFSAWVPYFIMYGIPLLYGIFLRHTVYRGVPDRRLPIPATTAGQPCEVRSGVSAPQKSKSRPARGDILQLLPAAIAAGCEQMTILGGYMIVCNALRAPMQLLLARRPKLLLLGHCLLEVSGGLKALHAGLITSPHYIVYVHTLLAFGGICCYLQTASLLIRAGLSAKKYMLHKLALCSITMIVSLFLYKNIL